jgi:hypothetical protein
MTLLLPNYLWLYKLVVQHRANMATNANDQDRLDETTKDEDKASHVEGWEVPFESFLTYECADLTLLDVWLLGERFGGMMDKAVLCADRLGELMMDAKPNVVKSCIRTLRGFPGRVLNKVKSNTVVQVLRAMDEFASNDLNASKACLVMLFRFTQLAQWPAWQAFESYDSKTLGVSLETLWRDVSNPDQRRRVLTVLVHFMNRSYSNQASKVAAFVSLDLLSSRANLLKPDNLMCLQACAKHQESAELLRSKCEQLVKQYKRYSDFKRLDRILKQLS